MTDGPALTDPELQDWLHRITLLQDRIRAAIRSAKSLQSTQVLSRSVRDDSGDTIFGLDISAEEVLLPLCEEWAKTQDFVLVAEGIEPATGKYFGTKEQPPPWRLILDPVDGTRGLMYDKRSAWSLARNSRRSIPWRAPTRPSRAPKSASRTSPSPRAICFSFWASASRRPSHSRRRPYSATEWPV